MIISKLERAKSVYEEALKRLRDGVATQRGAKEARDELSALRAKADATGACPYCGKELVNRSPRHPEGCADCGSTLDKLLLNKSRISAGADSADLLNQTVQLYEELQYVPYALRGATGNVKDVVDSIEFVLAARTNVKMEDRASRRREIATNVMEREKTEILNMLTRCGADPDSEETLAQVDEIYWERQSRINRKYK